MSAVVLLVSGVNMMQRLYCELQDAIMRIIPDCGHLPHVENPRPAAKLIADFSRGDCN
jgi:pimeloyl-ACP methyl ester carboxylesterase